MNGKKNKMSFSAIPGNKKIKRELTRAVQNNRIAHAQLFIGPKGSAKLKLALAYAQYIHCEKRTQEDSCGICLNCVKNKNLSHPDMHIIFPTIKTIKNKKPISQDFLQDWKTLIKQNPFSNLKDWQDELLKTHNINKTPKIYIEEVTNIHKKLKLKNYEANNKIIIIWMPELMERRTSNKLLKILEEPPKKTKFILVSEQPNRLLPTIISRLQTNIINKFTAQDTAEYFKKTELKTAQLSKLHKTYNGDIGRIIKETEGVEASVDKKLETFKHWMRSSYQKNIKEINLITETINTEGRNGLTELLNYSIRIIRECIIYNYTERELLNITSLEKEFISKFALSINNKNCILIIEKIEEAIRNTESNGNKKIIFFELSLSLTKLLKE